MLRVTLRRPRAGGPGARAIRVPASGCCCRVTTDRSSCPPGTATSSCTPTAPGPASGPSRRSRCVRYGVERRRAGRGHRPARRLAADAVGRVPLPRATPPPCRAPAPATRSIRRSSPTCSWATSRRSRRSRRCWPRCRREPASPCCSSAAAAQRRSSCPAIRAPTSPGSSWHRTRRPATRWFVQPESTELTAGTRIWAAGEAAAVQRLRKHYFDERGVPRSHATIRGYWKVGRDGT